MLCWPKWLDDNPILEALGLMLALGGPEDPLANALALPPFYDEAAAVAAEVAEGIGAEAADLVSSSIGEGSAAEGADALIPSTLTRVIPNGIPATTLGAPSAADVFVTTPEEIEGLDAAGIAQRLTIPESPTGYQVFQFPTPESGLTSPVFRGNPGFVGGGYTAGGAPEFVIPNGPIPAGATVTTVP
jgi:hypothetical protein